MVKVKLNNEFGQLFLKTRGSLTLIGEVTSKYAPHHLALSSDSQIHLALVKDLFTSLHKDGYWSNKYDNGTKQPRINLKISDVKRIIENLDLEED